MSSDVLSDEEHSEYSSLAEKLMYLAVKKSTDLCVAANMVGKNVDFLKI